MKNKLNHISSYTELSANKEHPLFWNTRKMEESPEMFGLNKEQKEDLEKLKSLLEKLKNLSQHDEADFAG
jgi:ABC-type enterochelin transport system substrate-binding protein